MSSSLSLNHEKRILMPRNRHLCYGDRVRWRYPGAYQGLGTVAIAYPAPPRTNRWRYEVWWDNNTRSYAGGAELILVSRYKGVIA